MKVLSKSPHKTQQFAAKLAAEVLNSPSKNHAAVITLQGDLGAGKTTFTQGFVKACGIKEKVKSPTFLLIKRYLINKNQFKLSVLNFRFLYHIDCYRVDDWRQLESLEIRHILRDPQAIVLVEWAERISKILPRKRVKVRLEHKTVKERIISIT